MHDKEQSMKTLHYEVRFLTPAFLGNAGQSAQWRTPPFKALLRQWWRVAATTQHGTDFRELRKQEGRLFGHAWLENDRQDGQAVAARRSAIRLRLDHWNDGTLKSWQGLEQGTVRHPEAEKVNYQIGPHAYLGYGPLDGRGGTRFREKMNAAIQSGETATLSLAVPEDEWPLIRQALWLIDRFGTVGGRSRNGWGSFSLTPLEGSEALQGTLPLRGWQDCLALDWPHALGQDGQGPLLWQTGAYDDWKTLMKELAVIKIGMRRLFIFPQEKPDGQIHDRHWLSYPVTRHSVKAWGSNARLPNSLRFKVRSDAGSPGELHGAIFHVPCLPPAEFWPDRQSIEKVWQRVHTFLSQRENLTRVRE